MKNKTLLKSILALSMGLGIVSIASLVKTSFKNVEAATTYYNNHDGDTYYNGIDASLEGSKLLEALQSLNSSKRKETVGYSSMGTSPSGQFKYTDYDPNYVQYDDNNQPYGTKILSFYSGNSATSWNREHVWPNSRGGSKVENDIHMPRPTIPSENGSRGNSFYVEGMRSSTSGWDPAMESFGLESYRGDSARIIFYCCVANSSLTLVDATDGSGDKMGKLSDLLKWNLENPVLQREQNRNEGAEYLQGNRNPFIDHPEYACKIWGNTNETTKAICSKQVGDNTPTSITITPSELDMIEGDIYQLQASSDAVTWSSSNDNIATVTSAGLVKAISSGEVTIKATSVKDSNVFATSKITIKSLKSLTLEGKALKNEYDAGEKFDPTGLTVKATYSDNSVATIPNDKCLWVDGTNHESTTLELGTKSVECVYGNKRVSYYGITVKTPTSLNYSITFKNAAADGSTDLTSTTVLEQIESGSDYVSSVTNLNKIYVGEHGLKFSSKSSNGTMTINVSSTLQKNIKGIKVKVSKYNNDEGKLTITTNFDTTGKEIIPDGSDYEQTLDMQGNLSSITLIASKRIYLNELVIITEGSITTPANITSVAVSPDTITLKEGETSTLTAIVTGEGDYNSDVTWSSSDESVVTVINGEITAIKEGSAAIYATASDNQTYGMCLVTVIKNKVEVTSLTLDKVTLSLKEGETYQLVATITPNEAEVTLIWSTSDETLATVTNGLVTAIKEGSVTITVKTSDDKFEATCEVTITSNQSSNPGDDPDNPDDPEDSKDDNKKLFGCIGSISATSTILSVLSLMGIGLIIKRKNK